MKTRNAAALILVLALGAFGYAAGRLTSPHLQEPATPPAAVIAPTPEQVTAPAPALEELDDLPRASFESVLYAVARATPESLHAYEKRLEDIKESPARAAAIEIFFRTLMQTNPSMAKTMMLQLGKNNRLVALLGVKNAAPAQAMPQVAEILMTFDPGETSSCNFDYLRDALHDWSETDPRAAKDFLEAQPHAKISKEAYYSTVLTEWAAYEPNEAREWMDQAVRKRREESKGEPTMETERQVQYLEEAWVEGLFRYDHKAAMDYVVSRTGDPDKDCSAIIVENLFIESPDEARAFVEGLPADRQAAALKGIDKMGTYRMAENDGNVGTTREGQITSPEFVANWMSQFPPETWGGAAGTVIAQWRNKDVDGLFAWMQALPTEAQQVAIANYAPYLITKEATEKEFDTVMRAQDGQLRTQLLEQIVRKCDQSKDIMLACLEKAPLSEGQKQYLAGLIPEQIIFTPATDDD